MALRPRLLLATLTALAAACGAAARTAPAPAPPAAGRAPGGETAPRDATDVARPQPVVPPAAAFMAGFMPLRSTGVEAFRSAQPTYDGRGVLIAILDSGIDPGTAGLITTSTGGPKLLDVRDFSREGRVALAPIAPAADGAVTVAGRRLLGARRVARITTAATWYAGLFRELPLGPAPAGDVNGDGTNTDEFPLVVVRASDGWAVFIDTNLNGSLDDEMPLHDYRQGRETISLGRRPITLAANLTEVAGAPVLDLVFDTSGHGTHVAAIAAGHNLFNVAGFHGVAPGAQLIGLKIANNARGGVSVHGSIMRAMEYAVRFAQQRGVPVVLNLSFGVGNEREGGATIDSLVTAFLTSHPDVVLTVAAGNDGPGLSTLGFPGSADLALTVGAIFPGAFGRPAAPGQAPGPDVLGWWSSRGGELAKPDVLAPGVVFAAVPAWDTGNEIKVGTSMAAPYAAGLMACLISGLVREGHRVSASELIQALRMSARPVAGAVVLDQGAGVPRLDAAFRWLGAGHQGSSYVVRAGTGASAAFRRNGLTGPGDTLETFRVRHVAGLRAAQFRLRVDQPWLSAPAELTAAPRETAIPVTYRAAALAAPGVYVGRVAAYTPSDTLAGPLFTLVNTIIVPHDLGARAVVDDRRAIPAGQTLRYFLRAGPSGATLQVVVTLPDSLAQAATVRLFEPNGQPLRGVEEIALGQWEGENAPGTARLEVRAEDLVPGVYELTVTAAPVGAATVGVRAELGPVAIAGLEAGAELSNPRAGSVALQGSATLVGVERTFAVTARGQPPESLTVRVPAWADEVELDVRLPPERWGEFTDFGVTVFDSSGQQVSQGPMNYAISRQRFAVTAALVGRPLTVELFPAYAREDARASWRADVRVRFLASAPRMLVAPEPGVVVAGGRSRLTFGALPVLEGPEGFAPLVELRVRPARGPGAASAARLVVGSR